MKKTYSVEVDCPNCAAKMEEAQSLVLTSITAKTAVRSSQIQTERVVFLAADTLIRQKEVADLVLTIA